MYMYIYCYHLGRHREYLKMQVRFLNPILFGAKYEFIIYMFCKGHVHLSLLICHVARKPDFAE